MKFMSFRDEFGKINGRLIKDISLEVSDKTKDEIRLRLGTRLKDLPPDVLLEIFLDRKRGLENAVGDIISKSRAGISEIVLTGSSQYEEPKPQEAPKPETFESAISTHPELRNSLAEIRYMLEEFGDKFEVV